MFGSKLQSRDRTLIYLMLLIASAMLFASHFGKQHIENSLIRQQAEAQALRWGAFVQDNLSDVDATMSYGKITEEDQELIGVVAEAGNVFRYKFFNQDGVIVLASRLDDLGTQNTESYFKDIVQRGGTYVTIDQGETFAEIEAAGGGEAQILGAGHLAVVAKAYVPLIENGRFKGAIEVYVDASAPATQIRGELFKAQIGIVSLLSILGIVAFFVLRANIQDRNQEVQTLTRAHESMGKAEEEVLRLNEELERRVQERTLELEKANQVATEAAEGIKRLNEDLERRVEERTEQMTKANDQLYRLNESMTKLNESLEERVAERTAEIERANEAVRQLNEDLEHRVEERTAELKQTQTELVRSERLATLGQLTATVSHELRNPLGAIRTAIYLIRGRTENQNLGVESALERADRSISRCDNIINELLDFTRSTPLAPEAADFDAWLVSVLSEQNLPETVTLNKQTGANGTELAFDHERLRRVIINLFNNACEAMVEAAENGAVTHPLQLNVQTFIEGGHIKVIFKDNGPGIPPDVLAKIWEPLFSTKSFGVGLGLPTVRQIMEQHDGGIDITSQEGQGTEVRVWLPVNLADERAA